ncbi:type II 3-dehydroquinate dehydratase [Nocardioides panacisoli]|uniref:type II 3-dehydroquinate dehydratase n=1 Tax=Nocardioides panacisoli TaxID=627624 RepID=UPI001C6323C9|nr:type II 3-dehydroquinate dehydratase [Nocardioides panacisoli]QYJ03558.1 type II 3-dehydroquinate dehydratase [Nocardioides panacisoli]
MIVHVLNGPNLNLLGQREPGLYGREGLEEVAARCRSLAASLGSEVDFRQSNHEGELVTWLHECGADVASGRSVGAVLNAGAYTHTSVALRDAIVGASVPVVEVHLTNVHAREEFRHHSHLSPVARGVVVGLGATGYELAIRALHDLARDHGPLEE